MNILEFINSLFEAGIVAIFGLIYLFGDMISEKQKFYYFGVPILFCIFFVLLLNLITELVFGVFVAWARINRLLRTLNGGKKSAKKLTLKKLKIKAKRSKKMGKLKIKRQGKPGNTKLKEKIFRKARPSLMLQKKLRDLNFNPKFSLKKSLKSKVPRLSQIDPSFKNLTNDSKTPSPKRKIIKKR